MTRTEKLNACENFFDKLVEILKDSYESTESCNKDASRYLCPNGTLNEITYSSKPDLSFRVSDHWSWYANTKKCPNYNYIQCLCADIPYARKRIGDGLPSKPISASCVCLFENGKYRVVYGEYYDKKQHAWLWKETEIEDILKRIK